MYFWQLTLRARGVTDGPLFPQINATGREFAVRKREDGVTVMQKVSCETWEKTLRPRASSSAEISRNARATPSGAQVSSGPPDVTLRRRMCGGLGGGPTAPRTS